MTPVEALHGRAASLRASHTLRLVPLAEWRALRVYRPNVLIEGPKSDVEDTLVALMSDFDAKFIEWQDLGPALVTTDRSIVVREVGALGSNEQMRLLELLDNVETRIQVIATSSSHLFDSVNQHSFRSDLYYRLTAVRLVVGPAQ
jgi:hypothetical protein